MSYMKKPGRLKVDIIYPFDGASTIMVYVECRIENFDVYRKCIALSIYRWPEIGCLRITKTCWVNWKTYTWQIFHETDKVP